MEFKKSDEKVMSIRLGMFDLVVAVEFEDSVIVEFDFAVEVEVEVELVGKEIGSHLDFLRVFCGFPLVGTGLGSPVL